MRKSMALLITVLLVPAAVSTMVRGTDPTLTAFLTLLVVGSLGAALLYTALADGVRGLRALLAPRR